MGFGIAKEIRPQKVGELSEGDVFVAHVPGGGRLVGMIGGNDTERLLVVLGSEKTTLDKMQVGWFYPDTISDEAAYKIEGATVEVTRNERGYAEAVDHIENGCVIIDAQGRGWIYTDADNSRVSFDLETGLAGSPARPISRYRNWRVTWTPPGETERVVLWRHEVAPEP